MKQKKNNDMGSRCMLGFEECRYYNNSCIELYRYSHTLVGFGLRKADRLTESDRSQDRHNAYICHGKGGGRYRASVNIILSNSRIPLG